MSDSRLYSRLLLPKGHGYPLFHPQPFDDLPEEARRVGTEIGDVGVVTSDGSFDVIFNICRAADDPINRFGVPEGFEQVRLVAGDVAPRTSYHRSGSDVSNTKISKRRLDIDASMDGNVFLPLGAGAVVEISTSSKEAAVLLLPDGASRSDLRRLKKFRNYALKHAQRWYAFVNGELERMVESNALYLVTGVDKSSSWSVAAVENQSEDCRVSLKLKAAQVGTAGTTCAWEWETASSFADSGPRRLPGEELWKDNQTVFLRGFKVAIRPTLLQRPPKALSIVDSKPSEILSKSGFIPYSGPSSRANSFYRSPTQPNSPSNSDDSEYIEYFPASLAEAHPANGINAYLLDSHPDAMVAVTHDNQWASVLNEDDDKIPEDAELIRRVLSKYETSFAQGGGIWLGYSQFNYDLGPQRPLSRNLSSCSAKSRLFLALSSATSVASHGQNTTSWAKLFGAFGNRDTTVRRKKWFSNGNKGEKVLEPWTESWIDLGLSSHLLAISTATEELKTVLRKAGGEVGQKELNDLESKISFLRKSLSISNPERWGTDPRNHPIKALRLGEFTPVIQKLAEDVKDTLWDGVPRRAVAKAHKDAGDKLFGRGRIDSDSLTTIYREYAKYLLLHPERDDAEYVETFKKIQIFQDALDRPGGFSTLDFPQGLGGHARQRNSSSKTAETASLTSGPTEAKKSRWGFWRSSGK